MPHCSKMFDAQFMVAAEVKDFDKLSRSIAAISQGSQ
jgi:hypothetical protein